MLVAVVDQVWPLRVNYRGSYTSINIIGIVESTDSLIMRVRLWGGNKSNPFNSDTALPERWARHSLQRCHSFLYKSQPQMKKSRNRA